MANELGFTTFRARLYGLPIMTITQDTANLTYILKTNFQNYGKSGSGFKSKFQQFLGDGIFNSDGPVWYAHRKTSSNLFKLETFRTLMIDTFNDDLDTFIKLLLNSKGRSVEIQAMFHNLTLESIAKIAFGKSLGCLEGKFVQFAYDFDFCTFVVADSCINPMWFFKRLYTGWEYRRCISRLNKFCYSLIQERRTLLSLRGNDENKNDENNSKKYNDLLSLYMRKEYQNNNDESSTANDTFIEPDDKNLRDVILNIILAGRDTTAQALTWAVFRLCTHPDMQEKLRVDIMQVLSTEYAFTDNKWQQKRAFIHIPYQAIQKMKYLDAFISEVLRLHPSVASDFKIVQKDDVLPDGTKVYKNAAMFFCPWIMGRSKELWGESALEFDPDRFLDKSKPSPFIYTAFQAGPRICLGMNFALLEMKCCLARLLLNFRFTLEQNPSLVTYRVSLTTPVEGGLSVSVVNIIEED
eukprot:gene8454-11432_t